MISKDERGRRVISLSLWGEGEVYHRGAIESIGRAAELYPGWELWFHLGHDVPDTVEAELLARGATTRRMPQGPAFAGMFWRFLPAADPSLDAMISRDADSCFSLREAAAVEEWLASGLPFHIMRDHPGHQSPIMGGMWGCRGGFLPEIESSIAAWPDQSKYGCDQRFLSRVIYPKVRGQALIHSEAVQFPGEHARKFPMRRDGLDFVGKAFRGDLIVHSQEAALAEWIAGGEPVLPHPLPWSLAGRLLHLRAAIDGRIARWRRKKQNVQDLWG